MSTCACSRCGTLLPAADINVAADTALCRHCGTTFRFSGLLDSGAHLDFDPAHPPQGASFQEFAGGFEVRATTGSSEAWFLVPFMLIWSGFAFGGIYGSQWQKGKFDLLESLFGIPFVILRDSVISFRKPGNHDRRRTCGGAKERQRGLDISGRWSVWMDSAIPLVRCRVGHGG